ncbi:unnamed protein product, partial [marine sediment metagenome]
LLAGVVTEVESLQINWSYFGGEVGIVSSFIGICPVPNAPPSITILVGKSKGSVEFDGDAH